MNSNLNLVLVVPGGIITATSLGMEEYAWHRSPGSGKYFQGCAIHIDLAITSNGRPDFKYLDEGGWREAESDTIAALASAQQGKRTKTALSNNAFSCTPMSAYQRMFLTKTGGQMLEMVQAKTPTSFKPIVCHEGMTPDQIATAVGLTPPTSRVSRLYMVFSPVQFIVLSNLTPEEYVWYATHRPGKKFRQVLFTELRQDQVHLAAESVYEQAHDELRQNTSKKTKTIVTGDCINRIPFQNWVGYHREAVGGIYAGDQSGITLWRFPEQFSQSWDRAPQ